jgi:N-acetyl-gamma-glutamyl-phosphate/LysW-gamma-L-alpha-aminoadipyl-6-phosphate reductase
MNLVRVGVVGASGYTGGELLRLLVRHEEVEVTMVTSKENVGKPVWYVHPNLRRFFDTLVFKEFSVDYALKNCDAVFMALPHGVGTHQTKALYEAGILVIDLSADYRLKDPTKYPEWYGFEHPYPDLLQKAVYGLPELHREQIRSSKLIACAGCNATATIISLAPLAKKKILQRALVDVKVGSSEGGLKPKMGSNHAERENAIRPYEASGHRHEIEAEQELSSIEGSGVTISVIPHAVSSLRGVLASSHIWCEIDEIELSKAFHEAYKAEPFVRIVRGGAPPYPDPKYVLTSNFVDVGFAVDKRTKRVTTFAALDNLMKGAAGQAVQCFNIAMGFKETLALDSPPPRAV